MIVRNPYPARSLMPVQHGGDLEAARALFPGAPEPFIDLSTAINPHPYPIPLLKAPDFSRLPEPGRLARLARLAAAHYGAPSPEAVVPAPGGQILMALIADRMRISSVLGRRAVVLGPTYAEHARVAALAGFEVSTVATPSALGEADLAIVVNPNNPDGRTLEKDDLLTIASQQRAHGGLLVVDEAFMDVTSPEHGLSSSVQDTNIVVLRSFGKFFGLAGLRLSFALADAELAARLRAKLGPWPVAGPALTVGIAALNDDAWIDAARETLGAWARRLTGLLGRAGLSSVGRTDLFTLVQSREAQQIFMRLGRAGLYVRRFVENPEWLRFGIPPDEAAWTRLEAVFSDQT